MIKSTITSLNNPRIKDLRKLKEKKYRLACQEFLIEGSLFVQEALRQKAVIRSLIVSDERLLDGLTTDPQTEVLIVPYEVIKDLASTVTPQGILACVELPQPVSPQDFFRETGLWFYLDEIRDPGNLGTIIRSAHAFNIDGLILSKGCADPYQDKVLRSTMGSIFKVALLTDQSPQLLSELVVKGTELYLTDLYDAGDLATIEVCDRAIVVIGNEARGVSDEIKALPHKNIRIPMPGGAESLNAAVAASLIMYELNGRD